MIKITLQKEHLFQDINKKQYISLCNVLSVFVIKFKFTREYNSFTIKWCYKHFFDFVSVIKRHELNSENIIKLEKLGITI